MNKVYYDKNTNEKVFNVNDLVLLVNKDIKQGISKKLMPNFKGPYRVTKVFSNRNVEIEVGKKFKIYHVDMLKHYIPGDDELF